MKPYLYPREKYATIIYETILENGPTSKWKIGLSESALKEGKEEFRDHPWKYGNKALICDPYSGTYKFAETKQEAVSYLSWILKNTTTRETRGVRVIESFTSEYGSDPTLDHFILNLKYLCQTSTHLTESGLYITG